MEILKQLRQSRRLFRLACLRLLRRGTRYDLGADRKLYRLSLV